MNCSDTDMKLSVFAMEIRSAINASEMKHNASYIPILIGPSCFTSRYYTVVIKRFEISVSYIVQ